MLERLKYKNHMNEVYDFGKNGVYVNLNELHDYEWSVVKKNNRISALKREIKNVKLPITIICATEQEAITAKNKLLEVCEKDVLALQPGRVIIGDYYFNCFVTKSKKKDYLLTKRHMVAELTLTTDNPYWIKESKTAFVDVGELTTGLDYMFDYPYDYCAEVSRDTLINQNFVASNFKLIIYGACTNPAISIAGHTYQVNCEVKAGEYLTVDSMNKKIFLTNSNGTVINVFNNRNKESYIFEKIPSGVNDVVWTDDFGFDVVLYEERSEPKWT